MRLLLSIGPQLGIVASVQAVAVGSPGAVTFTTRGSVGAVQWRLGAVTLPGEWTYSGGSGVTVADSVSFSTSKVLEAGSFSIMLTAVDAARQPVRQTFTLRAVALLTIEGLAPSMLAGGLNAAALGSSPLN
jgi:hypothetical protein